MIPEEDYHGTVFYESSQSVQGSPVLGRFSGGIAAGRSLWSCGSRIVHPKKNMGSRTHSCCSATTLTPTSMQGCVLICRTLIYPMIQVFRVCGFLTVVASCMLSFRYQNCENVRAVRWNKSPPTVLSLVMSCVHCVLLLPKTVFSQVWHSRQRNFWTWEFWNVLTTHEDITVQCQPFSHFLCIICDRPTLLLCS